MQQSTSRDNHHKRTGNDGEVSFDRAGNKKRIISQQYPASAPLPDQFALAAEFNTSRMTIQQAMRQLIVEGLIYTRKGQGTFVRKNFLQLSQWELPGSDYFGATKTWEHLGK